MFRLEMDPMTLDQRDEISQVGDNILIEYESRLKTRVRGARPYDHLYTKRIARDHKDPLLPGSDKVEEMVRGVLDDLLALNDGFWMSEPANEAVRLQDPTVHWTIERSGIKLTFDHEHYTYEDQQQLWVKCWYFPAESGVQ
jgi:hypothetical protein